ncbi:phosphoribosyl-AMP cyclohydrolase [Parasaccharibacter sp. TMW2.1882]|uniref:phosphoribosyl-AMP cyclohydrolase n=1 Tax=Acetobacteraceae TaxID=433 RepID=UPI000A36A874|nr:MULTISPECIES: phosphoribosyl-AMP cyclohydrolase [Acetobacteraceae]MCL1496115.1 phosphoribosyl-AMP cyclohydrolase [Parasaccharibacter sp. TMW2.1882]MCT6819058.1 phosphoribosyl-AMP cyclohydrolase [Bombella apis]MUH02782.1 phosphoribosyl-AMP cyclohydrolase [Bombella sp. ESL0387]
MPWQPITDPTLTTLLDEVHFNSQGLISAIAQDENGEVLMLAWMNREALAETLATGRVCYYSRSRNTLWRKGESSGQEQHLLAAALDCDADCLLLTVQQKGVACHTGRRSCFYQSLTPAGCVELTSPAIAPEELYSTKKSS